MKYFALLGHGLLFLASLWLVSQQFVIPLINLAPRLGLADTLQLIPLRAWLILLVPIFFSAALLYILMQRWSRLLYLGNYLMLIIALIALMLGGLSYLNPGERVALPTLGTAALLLVLSVVTARLFKAFKPNNAAP